MSVSAGPKVIKNGLVFEYDMENIQKSWKGKPLTNYYDTISTSSSLRGSRTQHFWDGYHWVVNATYSDPGVMGPEGVYLGLVYKHTSGALSSSWSGNSYGYMLKDIASTSGSTYTMSVWTYMSSDCNIDQLPCTTEGATTPNITVSGYPVQYNTSAKGTWQRLARSAVSDGNVRWIPVYPAKWGVTDGSFTGFFMWAAAQVEDGSIVSAYAGDDTSYARSNTEALIDLTGQNVITATELTYESSGLIKFDGSNDYATISTFNNKPTTQITCEAWIKPTKPSITGTIRGGAISATNSMYLGIIDSTDGGNTFSMHWANQTSVNRLYNWNGNIPNNSWSHLVGTYDGSTTRAYLNGVEIWSAAQTGTISNATYVLGTYGNALQDGVHNLNGYLGNAKIYNRALTDGEVRLNFNALRGRYGI